MRYVITSAAAIMLFSTLSEGQTVSAHVSKAATCWRISCGSVDGPEGRAVELLTAGVGEFVLREPGVYSARVLPVYRADGAAVPTNANLIVIGTLEGNSALCKWIRPQDVPSKGYLVRVFSEFGFERVLIAGAGPREVLWGVADYLQDGLAAMRKDRGNGISFRRDVLLGERRADYESRRAPKTAVRSVFTWGHPIDNFHEYFRNLALLKVNRVYLWNDYPPLNAREVVDCAHSWGVDVYWGFAWGWSTDCSKVLKDDVDSMCEEILEKWRCVWRNLPGDGVYFQTFTETPVREIDGEPLAARAVRLVNRVAARIFEESPDMRIVFGLHAISVRDRLDCIAKTDPRLEILWEDTGSFPYWHRACEWKNPSPSETIELTNRVLDDDRHPIGIVWKCQLQQDWSNWSHQEGPYLLGVASRRTYDRDLALQEEAWKLYTEHWISNLDMAVTAARLVQSKGGGAIEMNLAAQLNGPIRFPTALVFELFWDASESPSAILSRVLKRTLR